MEAAMMKRYLTLAVAAAILATPAALAASGQTKTSATATVATKQASARQAFGAVPASAAANSAEGVAVARPPAQPGAW
jgi:Ni/Co efflux regulator RcnB